MSTHDDHTDPADRPRSDTMKYLLDRFVGDDPGRRAAYERELAGARAEMVDDEEFEVDLDHLLRKNDELYRRLVDTPGGGEDAQP